MILSSFFNLSWVALSFFVWEQVGKSNQSMNISYNWLKELVDIKLPPDKLADKLTSIGLELDGSYKVNKDHVFDIEVTSNRGDCLSHLGVAREIAAFSRKEINFPSHLNDIPTSQSEGLVKIKAPDLCRRFTARIIQNVKIRPSPQWLKDRLEIIGERSINNVADITNYVMHELGQPMHAFDLNKLAGNQIVVRRAKLGETVTTLDKAKRKLTPSMLVICDGKKPVSIGAVMGGFDSGINETTTNVLLEVAHFDCDMTRKTSRSLNLFTEASHRFERGVDIENIVRASNRATKLICELTEGIDDKFVDVYPTEFAPVEIKTTKLKSEVKRLTGLDVGESEILQILVGLGIKQQNSSVFVSPSWRHDLAIEEDLVEEIARIHGYDKIGEELPKAFSVGEYQNDESRKRELRKTLAGLGFKEAISYSFIDSKRDGFFETMPNLVNKSFKKKFVSINNPIIEGASRMRPSLISGLLDATRVNFNQQNKNVKLFEIGKVFGKFFNNKDLPKEREVVCLLLTGEENLESSVSSSRRLNFYDLKGVVDAGVDSLNLAPLNYSPKMIAHLQPGQSAELTHGDQKLGTIGKLNSELSLKYKFKQPIFVAEINLQKLLQINQKSTIYKPLPIYPSVSRDVSLQIKRKISFNEIQNEVKSVASGICRKIEFVDVFEGKGMKENECSITIRLEYRSDEKTLTEKEVQESHEKILSALKDNLGGKQR